MDVTKIFRLSSEKQAILLQLVAVGIAAVLGKLLCFTTLVTFLLTRELQDTGAGLLAAAMVAIVPGYISRSVAGSYDNEGIAIFCMLFTFYLWIKSVKTGYISWACACSLAYFYMALGVFGLCQLFAFYNYLQKTLTSEQLTTVLRVFGLTLFSIAVVAGSVLSATGKISPWTGRFYSLLDPTYAKNHIPIIASVAEHQPTAWSCYYFDLQFLTIMFPGKYLSSDHNNNNNNNNKDNNNNHFSFCSWLILLLPKVNRCKHLHNYIRCHQCVLFG
ncbi:unnamed protein product [Trichobilharzia regenti]|nr:unnamed protein product [Trichobilharzia regenti]